MESTGAANMTLYRMTQFGVVDMTNKNTGDVPGDTSTEPLPPTTPGPPCTAAGAVCPAWGSAAGAQAS